MSTVKELSTFETQIKVARDEIRNIRKTVDGLKRVHKKECDNITRLLTQLPSKVISDVIDDDGNQDSIKTLPEDESSTKHSDSLSCLRVMRPIGHVTSVFATKNGTPRQGLVAESRGTLIISKNVFNNPSHSLQGLDKYSHVWIIFAFHKNDNSSRTGSSVSSSSDSSSSCSFPSSSSSSSSFSSSSSSSSQFSKAKVHPPRLDGASMGVFACRSPHRPNPIGLTLAKIESIRDNVIQLSGIDLINDTPVLDLKPYIEDYDRPARKRSRIEGGNEVGENEVVGVEDREDSNKGLDHDDFREVYEDEYLSKHETMLGTNSVNGDDIKKADWLRDANEENAKFRVFFTPTAIKGLKDAFARIPSDVPKPESVSDTKGLIENVLREDPRSVYRKTKCREMLYFSTVCGLHVTSWFDDDDRVVTVMKIAVLKCESDVGDSTSEEGKEGF